MSLEAVRAALEEAGLNLTRTLPVETYDALVSDPWKTEHTAPGCRGVLVVGNAGRALWPRFKASPEAGLRKNPLDTYTARVMREAAGGAPLADYTEQRYGAHLPLVAIGRRAGFGTPGRVGVLIHPEFGPWIALRGLIWLPYELEPEIPPAPFDPCTGCPAPCVSACHGNAIGPETVAVRTCYRTRILKSPCRRQCDARRACVVGPEHAYSTEQTAHHSSIHWSPSTLWHAADVLLRS